MSDFNITFSKAQGEVLPLFWYNISILSLSLNQKPLKRPKIERGEAIGIKMV